MNKRIIVPLRLSFIHARNLVDYYVVFGHLACQPATSHSEDGKVIWCEVIESYHSIMAIMSTFSRELLGLEEL